MSDKRALLGAAGEQLVGSYLMQRGFMCFSPLAPSKRDLLCQIGDRIHGVQVKANSRATKDRDRKQKRYRFRFESGKNIFYSPLFLPIFACVGMDKQTILWYFNDGYRSHFNIVESAMTHQAQEESFGSLLEELNYHG